MKNTELRSKLDTALDKTLDALIENAMNPNNAKTLAEAASTLVDCRHRIDGLTDDEGTVDIPEVKP